MTTAITNLYGYSGTLHVAACDPTNETTYYIGQYYTSGRGEGVPSPSKSEQSRCVTYHYGPTREDAILAAETERKW